MTLDTADKHIRTTSVEFSCHAPNAKAVFVADTLSDWKPDAAQLHPDLPNGTWRGTLPLPPDHHEYKFVVDGQWCCERGCEHEYRGWPKCVPKKFGTMNRVLEVR
jgi:1,4-alpha-glucan branching enzyme